MRYVLRFIPILILLAFVPSRASAIMLYATPKRNLTKPTGAFANSGWQWQGQWGGSIGTVISKKYIITAAHVGGDVGTSFVINGVSHRASDVWGDPNSDLRIFKTVGTYDSWAPLYTGKSEVGKGVTIFGRGTPRGDAVFIGRAAKGWKWGTPDARQSWGTNVVTSIADAGKGFGQVLSMNFDEKGPNFEGALTSGDSGGGLFVKDGSVWKLAGVNYGADGPYSTSQNGTTFQASLFDRGGLWSESSGFAADKSANVPGVSFSTRISANMAWINGVLSGQIAPGIPDKSGGRGVPEPASAGALLIVGFTSLAKRRRPRHA